MLAPRSNAMDIGSEAFTVCVSLASVSAFVSLVAVVLVLVWIWLRQVSPREREDLEGEIADLQRQLGEAQNQERRSSSSPLRISRTQRQDEELRRTKDELKFKVGELSKAWDSITNLKVKVDNQNRELQRTEEFRKSSQMNATQLERLRSQIQDLSTENARLKDQVRRASETKQNGEERSNRAFRGTKEEPRKASQTNEMLSTQLPNTNREWETKPDDERKQYQDLFARNQYLQDELKAARIFGSTEDQYAGAEVVDKVEKLNSEILQVAATLAEGLDVNEWANNRRAVDTTYGSNAKHLAGIIGRDLVKVLGSSASQDLSIVLQTAFQASMAYHAALITSSWSYRDGQKERLFNECYSGIQANEIQSVSGRWRRLAMTHLKGTRSGYEQRLMPNLVNTIADIVVAAGYRQDAPTVQRQITDRFAHRLEEVIRAAQDLHRIIGEEVTSCDFTVVLPQPGMPYDPGVMEETFGPSVVNDREDSKVACVTDVGLRSREKVSGSTKTKESVLLKAKVLLPSALSGIPVRDN